MPRLSLVIPNYMVGQETEEALKKCLASLPFECEKVVVCHTSLSYAQAVNRGIKATSGDYVAVFGNDTEVTSGSLMDLCVSGTVTSPTVNNDQKSFHGAFWVAPREVLDKVGLMDEAFEGLYYVDDDFLKRLQAAEIPMQHVPSVVVSHVGGLTAKALGKEAEWSQQGGEEFKKKYG